jgi:molecular chaperone DnaK (HSP70)
MATNPTHAKGPYIGIDFGTTKTMVAVYDPDRRTAMPVTLGRGRFELPTSIYYSADGDTLFGDDADDEGLTDQPNHIRRFKTKLGRTGIAHVGRHPATAVALTADFLRHIRSRLIQEVVHAEVKRIVLTAPALFGAAQRSALKEAAKQAGFTEVELLAEPSAAGIGYLDHHSAFGSISRFLVVDWGGGTFDVALIERTASGDLRIDPALVTGLLDLGGEDLDDDLWASTSAQLERLGYGRLDSQPMVHWGNYRRELSGAKERLSNVLVSRSRFVLGGDPVNIEIARSDFEDVIRPKVEQAVGFVSKLLADCNDRARTPEFILLAGGTSRVPLFGDILGKSTSLECRQWSSGRESIALGAAIHAYRVFGLEGTTIATAIPSHKPAAPASQQIPTARDSLRNNNTGSTMNQTSKGIQGIQPTNTRSLGTSQSQDSAPLKDVHLKKPNEADNFGEKREGSSLNSILVKTLATVGLALVIVTISDAIGKSWSPILKGLGMLISFTIIWSKKSE